MCSSRATSDFWLVTEPVYEPLFVRQEIGLFAENPLTPFLLAIDADKQSQFLVGETGRYVQACHYYHLCLGCFCQPKTRPFVDRKEGHFGYLARTLTIEIRWQKDLKWIRGRGQRYTDHQKKTAQKYHTHKHFTELDFINCLLHARIVCDRAIALSRRFLQGHQQLPSFTSFNKHRDFFIQREHTIPSHTEYAQYIRQDTDWFEILKPIRDKFIVHHGPKHTRWMGWQSDYDLELMLNVPEKSEELFGKGQLISISIRRLARDLRQFLTWFSGYGLEALE